MEIDHLYDRPVIGNDLAVEYARSHSQQGYPAGSVISLVTWTQREDPRWFGKGQPGSSFRQLGLADPPRGLSKDSPKRFALPSMPEPSQC